MLRAGRVAAMVVVEAVMLLVGCGNCAGTIYVRLMRDPYSVQVGW